MLPGSPSREVERALRWRGIALVLGALLLVLLVVASLSTSAWIALAAFAVAVPLVYAAVWGMSLRVDLAGKSPVELAAREVLGELAPPARIDSKAENKARVRIPLDAKAAIVQYHDIRLRWQREVNEIRIEAEPPMMSGLLSRTLLLRRADAWQRLVNAFAARGFAPRQ